MPKLGDSSPAGIRQDLQSDSNPVLIDERESDTVERQESDDDLRLMMRQSSSGNASIVKGTQGGHALTFLVQSCFFTAGTTQTIHFRADQSRQTIFSLYKDPGRNWAAWEADLARFFTPDFGARFRRRIIDRLPEIVTAQSLFTTAAAEILGDARSGDQLGTIILGAWFSFKDEVPTAETAASYCTQIIADYRGSGDQPDEVSESVEVLRTILQSLVYCGSGERKSLGELIISYHIEPGNEDARRQLWRHGIRLEMGRDGYEVLFARNHTILTQLAGRFGRSYAQRLSEIPGAYGSEPMKFGDEDGKGRNARAIAVPFDEVEDAIQI